MDILTNGQLRIYMAAPSNNPWTVVLGTSVGAIVANQWFHVAVTMSATLVCTLYLNGIAVTTATGTGNLPYYQVLVIGISGDSNRGYNGYMENVQIFNTVLSPLEVLDLVSNQVIAGSIHSYSFNDGTASDSVGGSAWAGTLMPCRERRCQMDSCNSLGDLRARHPTCSFPLELQAAPAASP